MTSRKDDAMVPKVSVLMSVYNGEAYLERSIESILSQTFRDFEFLIINDASTDSTEDILKNAHDPRIKVINNSVNLGLTKSLNRGIGIARGKYIARMDADDLSLPYRFEIQVGFLDSHPEYAILGSSYLLIDQEGRTLSLVKVPVEDSQIRENLLKQNCFGHGSVMIRREAVQKVGGYDERFKCSQDYELWLRIVEAFKASNIEEALYCWRMSNYSISKRNEWEQKYYASLARIEANRRKNANQVIREPTPTVSVIIPTYNRPESLAETIQSVADQTYSHFEVIVINDDGVDVSNIINQFKTKREVKYVKHDHNKGLPAARNTGIRFASGKYIAYLDDDDVFYPWHLEVLVNFLESNEFKVAFTEACRAYQTSENGKYIITKRDIPYAMDFDEDQILVNNMIPVLCVMHEKSCLDEVGLFDENLTTHEDWDLWIRMSRKFRFAHIEDLTCEFRWREDSTTMSSEKRQDFLWTMETIHAKYENYTQNKPNVRLRQKRRMLEILEDIYLQNSVRRVNPEFNTVVKSKGKLYDDYHEVQTVVKAVSKKEGTSALISFLKSHPDHSQANMDLGKILFQKGNKWQALAHIAKSLTIESDNIEATRTYARICFKLGLNDRALKSYQDVSRLNPNELKSLLAQVGLLLRLGRRKDALYVFLELIRKVINI